MGTPAKTNLLAAILLFTSLVSCREVIIPKPKGYFRIDMPEREYSGSGDSLFDKYNIPFSFEYPSYATISSGSDNPGEYGWYNIGFPYFKSKLYLTYKEINNDLDDLIEQTYTMNVKNHITKADAIKEQIISDDTRKVYGILYDLTGNTATSVQFFVTDSIRHYLRGSLYFSAEPNADSLAPVIDFLREDVIHLIGTLRWNED